MPTWELDPQWQTILRHRPATHLPLDLADRKEHLRFLRWMVLQGLVSDWRIDAEAEGRVVGLAGTTAGLARR